MAGRCCYAPLDIVLTDYDVVQPDLLLFTPQRAHLLNPRRVTRVPPDLAIEILSPSTEGNDRGRKMRLMQQHGVREFWLVDPDGETIEVYALNESEFVLASVATATESVRSPLLPELTLTAKF